MQGGAAEEGEAVDVAEVDLAGEQEEGAEEEEEEDGAREVRVVHDVLVDAREGVEDREGLFRPHAAPATLARTFAFSFVPSHHIFRRKERKS